MDRHTATHDISRRTFLSTTSAALIGAALGGVARQSAAAGKHPQRGGVLHFATSVDVPGLDSHRYGQVPSIMPTAAMYTGLTDIDQQGNIVPGIAESWEPNKDLTAWVFRLRKGVLFHNGREVDAEAVKLNFERMKNPAIAHGYLQGAIDTMASVDILDKYTVRFHTQVPDITLPSSVMHYPANLQAPDNFDKANEHPVGTGPFKFVSWTRNSEAKMVRFENYWETDAEGHALPYLHEIIGKPKKEDSVRLTALRTGQAQLIDTMAYADVERFRKSASDQYTLWPAHWGGAFVVFNCRRGVFQDKRLRTAAAHAIDRNAIHQSVFYGQGAILDQPFPPGDPWHLESRSLEYDPDKAKAVLQAARAVGTEVKIVCNASYTWMRESAQVVQEMWNRVGFKAVMEFLDPVLYLHARKEGNFDALSAGHTFRYDPDDFYGRNLHSQSDYTRVLSGWQNAPCDRLLEEAKRTLDPAQRKAMYTEVLKIVNDELPQFHLHEVTTISAGSRALRGYQPARIGAFTYRGGGLRTAYMQT